jgi:hypothetical protein
MAHVWVEVFIEGSGWIRIDPSTFAENAGNIFATEKSSSPILRLQLLIDSLNHSWNRTVIPYDFERQIDFVNYAGKQLHGINPIKSIRTVAPYIVIIALLIGMTFVARHKFFFRSREERILRSFFRQVERDFGFDQDWRQLGLFESADMSGSIKMMEFVTIYAGAVYRDRKLTAKEYNLLSQILRIGLK